MQLRLWETVSHLRGSVRAVNQNHGERARVFVEIVDGTYHGWGEVSPLTTALAPDPGVLEVLSHLERRALVDLADIFRRERTLPSWSRVHLLANSEPADGWAWAAIEMALLDLELVRKSTSIDAEWGVNLSRVPVMATTSLLEPDPSWTPPEDASRVRLKTGPGVDIVAGSRRVKEWALPVLLDFNGSAGTLDEVRRQLNALQRVVTVEVVEQPFAVGNLIAHAELAAENFVAVGLDESVRSIIDIRQIARYEAAQVVCVKPPRMGGLAPARAALAEASKLGLRSYVGGFFESPLARRAHRAVAAGFAVGPSDVGPVKVVGGVESVRNRPEGIGVEPVLDDARLVATLHLE